MSETKIDEIKPSEPKPMRMVRRSVAIAFGIICIILAVSLVGVIFDFQNQVNDLDTTLNLDKSTIWVNMQTISQPANSSTSWTFSASHAGYVEVWLEDATYYSISLPYYVRVTYYSSNTGVNYDNQTNINVNNLEFFPILPSSNIEIRFGNTNPTNGNVTLVVKYFY